MRVGFYAVVGIIGIAGLNGLYLAYKQGRADNQLGKALTDALREGVVKLLQGSNWVPATRSPSALPAPLPALWWRWLA